MKQFKGKWVSSALLLTALAVLFALGAGMFVSPTSAANPSQAGSSNRIQSWVLRVYFHDNAERDRLATELGAEEVATTGGYLTVIADRALFDQIIKMNLRYEVDQKQTDFLNNPTVFGKASPNTFYGGFKTVEEMGTFLNQYAATYPTLAQVVDFGDSWCKVHPGCTLPAAYNGYDLLALHITNQAIPGPKPVFWYDAGIHSREIATPEVAALYIQLLLDGYNSDPDAHWLVDYEDIWVIPMLNPDGHHIVESGGGGSSPYYQRKNSNNTNGCTTWPPSVSNQFGVDNNRNFAFMWNCCGGSSSAPCDQTYHGVAGNSDPETLAAVNEIRTLIPDQRGPNLTDAAPITTTGVYQNMHSNASLDLYPWGFQTTASPNGPEMAVLGHHLSATNAYPSGNNYQACQPPNCLYAVDGDAVDQMYGDLGIPSFTTEVGGSDFLVSLSYVNNTLWPANRGALVYQAKVARQPYLIAHGPDAAGVATNPMTVTQGVTSILSGTINYAWTGNTFSQNVAAAEYYIDTPPWAGGTAHAMTGNFSSPTVLASATIDTTGLSVGRHLIFVRGRGGVQVQGYDTWGPISAAWLWVQPMQGTPTPTVTGTPPTATNTPTATGTATPTATPCTSGITNGGFETGTLTPWTVLGTNPAPVVSNALAHSGTYSALLGTLSGPEPLGDGSMYQTITVPAGGGTLSYWWNGQTTDSLTFDWQDAYITNTSGTILTTIMHNCDTTAGWLNQTFDMAPYAGQTVRVEFLVHQDGFGDDTSMYVDDVQLLTACASPTPGGPTNTPTNTPIVPTSTSVAATNTPVPGTNTPILTDTPVGQPTSTPAGPTNTPGTPPTATPCTINFSDVHPTDYFYTPVQYLFCHGVISGYADNTFRPFNNTTRAQMVKIVVLGFQKPIHTPSGGNYTFTDVPPAYPFFSYIETAAALNIVSGYDCGGTGEPCDPDHRKYFRPSANVTRGQLSKIDVVAAGWSLLNPATGSFTDVLPATAFYQFVETAYCHNIISGYTCGGPGEPCDPDHRPYFRQDNDATRGQIAKIVYLSITTASVCSVPTPTPAP